MAIDTLFDTPPTPPHSGDAVPTFRLRYDAFLAYIYAFALNLISFITQLNSTEANINAKEASATLAATAAAASANFQGVWSSSINYSIGQSVAYNGIIYRSILAGSNHIPSSSPTYWVSMGMNDVIHAAPTDTPTGDDEWAFWDGLTGSLKKITYTSLLSVLSVAFSRLELGSSSAPGFIDFHSGATECDYDSRIISGGGNGTPGNGILQFIGDIRVPTPTLSVQAATRGYVDSQTFGINQKYTDVTASRALSTTYTNSTGKPIEVKFQSVDFTNGVKSASVTITYPDTTVLTFPIAKVSTSATIVLFGVFNVAPGAQYSITSDLAISKWMELR